MYIKVHKSYADSRKFQVVVALLPAVVLLSGGLDSSTVLAIAKADGYEVHALSVNYGQRNVSELESAKQIAHLAGVASHVVLDVNLAAFGGSALTGDSEVPRLFPGQIPGLEIPITYVPARNTVFLSLALSRAETVGSTDIFIGVNALDYSGYPDCRPEFIVAFEAMANLATKAQVEGAKLRIHAPLIAMTKSSIIQTGLNLGVDYSITLSCYDPDIAGRPCGSCEACFLRRRAFEAAGIADPAQPQ